MKPVSHALDEKYFEVGYLYTQIPTSANCPDLGGTVPITCLTQEVKMIKMGGSQCIIHIELLLILLSTKVLIPAQLNNVS